MRKPKHQPKPAGEIDSNPVTHSYSALALVPLSPLTPIPANVEDIPDMSNAAWARLPEESPLQYSYFKLYVRQGGMRSRSIYRMSQHLRVAYNTLVNYCKRYNWVARAAQYDLFWLEREDQLRAKMQAEEERKWASRRDQIREQEWEIAQDLIARARVMLSWPILRETLEREDEELTAEGIMIRQIIRQEPAEWSMSDLARFFELASKFARLATGMDTDRKRLKVDLSSLSDDELAKIANER